MSRRKLFLEVQQITDDDCGIYRIGEIDTLPDQAIKIHIEQFGEFGYEECKKFFIQGLLVAETEIRALRDRQNQASCGSAKG